MELKKIGESDGFEYYQVVGEIELEEPSEIFWQTLAELHPEMKSPDFDRNAYLKKLQKQIVALFRETNVKIKAKN